ncbi:hypothetical protein [Caulobacter sp. NIBR1757]|uniref:hypothetical protein n=1 Tax=Caulobacter sp. NIBR1757 TaxID=3016000 RepID=UPI0022F142DF|nr:hypothetical protein [Caulobacter sp. NIBR1757]WGM39006.1 hypothetical protein AMEJIAPC_01916 [Caulobacter sp. NIBR1757]
MTENARRGPVEVEFVSGPEPGYRYPPAIGRTGLDRRLAVIQHASVPGCPDMVFDEDLWRALADFLARQTEAEVCVGRAVEDLGREEWTLAAFLDDWERELPEVRYPPDLLLARVQGELSLCMVTEAWAQVGGLWPYADSWTYSLFSATDLSGDLPAFLRERSAGRWTVSDTVMPSPTTEKGSRRSPRS